MTSLSIESPVGASVFLLTAAITFSVYASTASESIPGGDSGELVSEGCTLGTSHPPGYPLYTIIVYLVTTLGKHWYPALSPAYLVNITSCLFGSISSGLLSLVVFQLIQRPAAQNEDELYVTTVSRFSVAISSGLICSFSPLMWQYNTSAEVFALHNLFVSLLVYVLVVYSSRPNSTPVIAVGSFLCGIALTNQHTSILLIVPVVAYVFYDSSMLTKPKLLLVSSLSFIFGISLYMLLPYLAINHPHAGSWGDVSTISGGIHHLLRRDYGTLQLYSGDDTSSEGMIVRTFSWAQDFVLHQICHLGLLLLPLIGCIGGLQSLRSTSNDSKAKKNTKKRKKNAYNKTKAEKDPSSTVWIMILFALVFYLGVFHSLSNLPLSNPLLFGIHQRFWMHPNVLVFILIGIGMHKSIANVKSSSTLLALSCMILLLPFATYRQNYSVSDQSKNNYFNKYALSILETLPSNSLLLLNYDQQWTSVRYLQECEGVRKDITSINLSMMTFEWWQTKHDLYDDVSFPGTHYTKGNTLPWANGGFTFSEFIDANVEHFGSNIFIGGRINFEDPAFSENYEEEPFGLVRKIQGRSNTIASAESYRQDSLQVWKTIANHLASDIPCEKKYPQSTWEWTIRREFFDHIVSRATFLLDLALKENDRVLPSIAEAAAWLELAGSWDKDTFETQSSMKKNLGLAYMNIVRSKESGSFPIVEDIFDNVRANDDGQNETDAVESGGRRHMQNWWTEETNGESSAWKEWATIRWREEWEVFLGLESAKTEPGYSQIKNIYDLVMNSSQAKANSMH